MKKRLHGYLFSVLFICSTLLSPLSVWADVPSTMPIANSPLTSQSLFPTGARLQRYGIAAHPWWLKLQTDNFIRYYKDLQVGVVRIPVEWKTLEPASGTFDWTLNDQLLNRLNDEGFEIIAEFVTMPAWASYNPDDCAKQDTLCGLKTDQATKDQLVAVTTALVKRYPFIRMWEFWNEPEQWPHAGQQVADYAPLLQTFYQAAKQADPNVLVAVSTLAGYDYIEWLYNYFDTFWGKDKRPWDAVAYHPYNIDHEFEADGTPSPLNKVGVERLHQLLIDRGDGNKPIWVTEVGWQGTPASQTTNLKNAFNWLDQRPYVTIVILHMLHDWNDELYGLVRTIPDLYHTSQELTTSTIFVPKQPYYDAYKYYPKRNLSPPPQTSNSILVFPQTLHSVQGPFVAAWQSGGLDLFGLPKTGQFYEKNPADGHYYLVQYFERVRMEYHPETGDVQFGLLGNQMLTERGWLDANGTPLAGPALPEAQPADANALFFTESGHDISGQFLTAWQAQGGLKVVGLPKTGVFDELNSDDGQTYAVQYFERARMELHPATADKPAYVTFGLLGNDRLRLQNRLDKANSPSLDDYYNPALPEFSS